MCNAFFIPKCRLTGELTRAVAGLLALRRPNQNFRDALPLTRRGSGVGFSDLLACLLLLPSHAPGKICTE